MNLVRKLALLAVPALLQFGAQSADAAGLVTNGSFDNVGGVWVDNTGLGSDDWQSAGATGIPGWSNVAGLANEFWASSSNAYGLTSSPGNASQYWVDLTGQANNKPYGGIEQSIATTAGSTYVLTFDLGASTLYNGAGFGAAALTASAIGSTVLASQLYTLEPQTSNEWASETLTFVADGSSTTIRFLADSDYTSRYTGLDNVSVAAVPEPSTWLLALGGLAIVGVTARRRAA